MKVTIWPDSRKAVLNTDRDKLLFRSPRNHTRGSDYFIHTGKYGRYFYKYNWSLKDETPYPYVTVLSGTQTKHEIMALYRDGFVDDTSTKRIQEFFPEFLYEVD